jgi:23S rRNA pseudouridine1911/1915/1917 synthase
MKTLWELIYEDELLLICHKAAGIPVQTAKLGQPDMVSILKNYCFSKGQPPEIYVVHRLDQPVEGIMVFAKTKACAAALSRQMQANTMNKHYHALTFGTLPQEDGILEDWLQKDAKSNLSRVVSEHTSGAKKARLSYHLLAQKKDKSLVQITLETGRHHQIRVQMSNIGCPIWGDRKYNYEHNHEYLTIGLCAVKLSFLHPQNNKTMIFELEPQGDAFKIFAAEPC